MSLSSKKEPSRADKSPQRENAAAKEEGGEKDDTENKKEDAETKMEDIKEDGEEEESAGDTAGEDEEEANSADEEQDEKGGEEEGLNVDLSRMKTLYQFRSRPTLPNLLTEYGMEDKGVPPLKRKEKEKKKKKRRVFGDDSGRDREREKQVEERQLQVLKDMKKFRDYLYDEYMTLLQNKVEQQRQDIRQRARTLDDKMSQKEETARQESHHVKQRLERNTFVSDDSFLDGLHKSDLFYITQLQDKLVKEGTLKSPADFDLFWERIQQPDIFYMYFKVPKSDDPVVRDDFNDNASSKAASTWKGSSSTLKGSAGRRENGGAQVLKDRSLSRIAESRESSRPGTRVGQHWAITQQFPPQFRETRIREKRRSSFTGLKQPQAPHKSTYLQDLEKRFPKLEMPKLHCFSMNLGPKAPDPEVVQQQITLKEFEKNRKKYTYKLNKMYQLAMTNAASANRILEMHEDLDFIINGAPLKDLISDQHFYSGLPPPRLDGVDGPTSSSPIEEGGVPPLQQTLPSLLEQEERDASTARSHKSSRKSTGKKKRIRRSPEGARAPEEEERVQTAPLPLSMGEVTGNSRVMEAKCMSTLWTNYLRDVPAVES